LELSVQKIDTPQDWDERWGDNVMVVAVNLELGRRKAQKQFADLLQEASFSKRGRKSLSKTLSTARYSLHRNFSASEPLNTRANCLRSGSDRTCPIPFPPFSSSMCGSSSSFSFRLKASEYKSLNFCYTASLLCESTKFSSAIRYTSYEAKY
jgi:hypothetical protein